MTRAKMICYGITKSGEGDNIVATVRLRPVYSDSPENKSWSKYTPSGDVMLNITNPPAIEVFVADKEYFVDFTPVEQD